MTAKPEAKEESFEEIAKRVDEALEAVDKLGDDSAKKAAQDLKTAVEDLHRSGLVTIVRKLKSEDVTREALLELVEQPEVRTLFTIHGIIKQDINVQITKVLEYVRPYMQSHGGDVEYVGFENGVAKVRMMGACNGCSQSAVTLREGVEEALVDNVDDVSSVEVVPNEPAPALVQIESIEDHKSTGWVETIATSELPPGKITSFEHGSTSILLVNVENNLSAYKNECPHQGLPLDTGLVDHEDNTLTCAGHGFKFDVSSGECLTAPQAQLEVFPLRVENDMILVRPN